MSRTIEITWPQPVQSAHFSDALFALCRIAGPCDTSTEGGALDGSTMVMFTAEFNGPVELPDGLGHALDLVTGMACEAWERENPTMVMWPAGHGFKPRYSQADAAFLGKPADPDAPASGEPTFDEETYSIECEAREDYHGRNPLNPDGAKLRELGEQERVARNILKKAERRAQERAFEIADEAMYALLVSEGYQIPCGLRLPPEASVGGTSAREAFDWLKQRGYVEADADDEHGEFIRVLREPGAEPDAPSL